MADSEVVAAPNGGGNAENNGTGQTGTTENGQV